MPKKKDKEPKAGGKKDKGKKDKGKKEKKSITSETKHDKPLKGNKIDWSKYPEGTTEINNPNFYFGTDKFIFKNGDRYVGEYCAHKCGLVWREGKGCYMTQDGHSYEGYWENDQLLSSSETKIIYSDGTKYNGPVKNGMYSGKGTYIPHKNVEITLNIEDNIPFGEVILTDNRQNLWKGNIVNINSEQILLLPENHFFTNLNSSAGLGKIVDKNMEEHIEELMEDINKPTPVADEPPTGSKLRDIVFKKSTKIPNQFEDKVRYQDPKLHFDDEEDVPRRKRIPVPKSSLLKARSGSNTTLWNKFVKQNIELAQGRDAWTIFRPTVDKKNSSE